MISQEKLGMLRRFGESLTPYNPLRGEFFEVSAENIMLKAAMDRSWPTQAQAARWVGVHRGQINRAIRSGHLETNAKPGRSCRINPASLWHWRDRREARGRAQNDAWAEGDG